MLHLQILSTGCLALDVLLRLLWNILRLVKVGVCVDLGLMVVMKRCIPLLDDKNNELCVHWFSLRSLLMNIWDIILELIRVFFRTDCNEDKKIHKFSGFEIRSWGIWSLHHQLALNHCFYCCQIKFWLLLLPYESDIPLIDLRSYQPTNSR